jgi:chemotaxis protein histidine kinase CheA
MTTSPPPKSVGLTDFFALEAGEYLERLDALLGRPEVEPAVEELVRLARALRGSALMANQHPIARAAAGLEALARAVREGRRSWDEATKQYATRAVDDLKIFVRRAGAWTDDDTAKAEALGAQLDQAAGRASAQIRAAEALGLDAGARAFVAREGAAIGSALDRASHALRATPRGRDPLQLVLKSLQPLRGLAAINDLPPLPDLLEGIERAIGKMDAASEPPTGASELFQAAAAAIAQTARGVAERGRPDPESAEFKHFAALLVEFLDREPSIPSIAALYFDDGGPHVVERGAPGQGPATTALGRVELVSHGEHLRQVADSLERAPSTTQRELRAHTIAGTFRALASVGGSPLADQLAVFATAARDAVARGVAVGHPALFAAELRRAADLLVRSSVEDETALAARLGDITAAVRRLTGQPPAAASTRIEETPVETPDIAGSWTAYERLKGAGVGPPSLEELLGGGGVTASATRVVTRPAAVSPPAEPVAPVVDIRSLLYRGESALRRAQQLREEARTASGEQLRALVEEVCDLVALAQQSGR